MTYTEYQRFKDRLMMTLESQGLTIFTARPTIAQAANRVAEKEGLAPPLYADRIRFLEDWLESQPNPVHGAMRYEFKPLVGYNLMANVPPNRDYRQYPSLFGSKRVWRDGRTEIIKES